VIRWIVGSGLRSRRIGLALAALTMLFGVMRLRDMPKDVLPEFAPPTVEVQTEALGLSASEVEELITVPLEQDLLNGVAYLDTIHSESIPGLSSIEMIFEPGTDLLDARQVVEERLTQAHALPQVSKPPQMLQPLSSTSRVMFVGLSSDRYSLIDMSLLARWNIRPRLMGVRGVANVAVWGQRERQLQVLVDPERLRANGVTLQQIVETSANAQFVCPLTFVECSTPGTPGFIETPTQRIGVRDAVPFATPEDLAKVIVQDRPGAPLRLGDVADIVVDHQLLIGDAVFSEGHGLLMVIEKLPGANALDVTRGVEEALDALRPGLSGVSIDTSLFRPGTFIERSNENLATALTVGGLLALLALGLILFNWRTVLTAAVAIVISVLVAVLILSALDTTLNSMIVAGLVLALVVVVDDAVGDVDRVARRLREQRADGAATGVARNVLDAASEMRSAAFAAALITLATFVPVFFTRGAFGAFFPSVALAYGLAVLASMAVALVVTPALGMILLTGGPAEPRESPIVRWIRPRYERALVRVIGSYRRGIAIVGVLVIAGLCCFPFLERSLTPSFKDTDVLVHLDAAPGTSLPEMERVVMRAARELRSLPGVLNVGGHAGRALLSDQIVGTNASELWVSVDPTADYDATRASIEAVVRGYPGLKRSVTTYPSERIAELLADSDDPVTVRVFGQDLGVLRTKAEEVSRVLAGIDGVVAPKIQPQAEEPTLEIEVDLEAAERFGIVPGDVRRAAATLLSGIQVGSLFDEQKVFDVVVWGTPDLRASVSSISNLMIDTPSGAQARLGDVAAVRIAASPNVIRHVDVSRSIDVTAAVSGRRLGDVVTDVRRGLRSVEFPIEYHAEIIGDFAAGQAADREALWFAGAAAIAIVLLLQASIGSWRLATAVFLSLAVALAGGAVAALLDGRSISLGSVAGFLGLIAVTGRHAVVQIRLFRQLERRGGEPFGPELVLRGTRERLLPVLGSVVTTAMAVVPLVVAGDIAGLEIIHPMAVVILGGLVSSTVVSLFVIPALYLRLGAGAEPDLSEVLTDPVIDLSTPAEIKAELTSS
jgi:Cu/Ag efflux pump CusA